MTSPAPPHPRGGLSFEDPRLVAFLPMLYVAWADGDLAPGEVRAIRDRTIAAGGAPAELLAGWLDPETPPSAEALARVLGALRRRARDLPRAERRSLLELGEALARAGGHEVGPAERSALERLESALALDRVGDEATRRLLAAERPEPADAVAPDAAEAAGAAFDPAALGRFLDGERRELREEVRRLLAEPAFLDLLDLPWEADRATYRDRVLAACRELARRGYGALALPEEHGGGGDPGAFVAAFETLALGDLSLLVKFGVQFGLFAGGVHQLGTGKHHARILPAAGRLELPGCFAMTEIGHGSNVQEVETVARYDPEHRELVVETPTPRARKDWIGNAARHGRMAVVFAQLEVAGVSHGVHAVLVPIRDAEGRPLSGVSIEDCGAKLGLNGVDNGRLGFDGVRVPYDNLLDRFGSIAPDGSYESPVSSPGKRFFTMLGTLVGGRVSVALAAGTAARLALTIAVRYAVRRRQFGPPGEPEVALLDYRTHQRRLLPRLAETYGFLFATRDLGRRYVESLAGGDETEGRELEARAACLKALATWHASDTIQECREACGGQGYLAENRFAALKADTDVFTTFEGDNTVLLQLAAKSLLSGYRQQFGSLDLLGMVRYLAGRAATLVTELNPVVTHETSPEHLRDPGFQAAALAWREEHLLSGLARRLKGRIDAGMDSFDALVECQDHVVATARAHGERLVYEAFAAGVEAVPEAAGRAVLETLRDLYAASLLERERGWFLSHRYLAPVKAKAVRDLVNRLVGELRPQAVALVDAFSIPEALLPTIARRG